jgi:alkanesulfonate monooxygenase SsuD/methylene tetrahydromethanopterin reductase-like flavin-dependent oxidoreductase (luciferase family)
MDFIFMLTRHDRTVEDAAQVLDLALSTGIRRVGFKDVGATREALTVLTRRIRQAGAISYMEVVSTTSESLRASFEAARDIGVDYVLGGQDLATAQEVLQDGLSRYYPFPGRPHGHPTTLSGTAEDVARDCRRFVEAGCAGADLLAYRASEADPLELVRAARENLDGRELVVAGSVDSPERIQALADAGADAFTIGSAIFDGSFSPTKGSFLSQIRDVLQACADARRAA